MTEQTKALTTLHTRLIDSIDGYEQALEKVEGDQSTFLRNTLTERRDFHDNLHARLVTDGIDLSEDGSTAAAIHRTIFNIRDALSSGDSGILAECARGDEHLRAAYDDAIERTTEEPTYDFLIGQRAKVAAAISEAKALA